MSECVTVACGRPQAGRQGHEVLSTRLPRWLMRLLPRHGRMLLLTSAAVLAARTDGRAVLLGQTTVYRSDTASAVTLRLPANEVLSLAQWGRDACLVRWATVLRTAIFVGLDLDGTLRGVISPSRSRFFGKREVSALIHRAGVAGPKQDLGFKYLRQGNEYGGTVGV